MIEEELIYTQAKPEVNILSKAFTKDLSDLDAYFRECQRSYEDRRNLWPGKGTSFRKDYAGAFPWVGASDQEVNVVGERVDQYIAMFMSGLKKANIKAYASNTLAMPRATIVSSFLKYLKSSYIPDFTNQMELAGNHLLEKKIAITYVGWQSTERTIEEVVALEGIKEMAPELANMILDEDAEDDVAVLLQQVYPKLRKSRARKAVRDLRTKGEATVVVSRPSTSRPQVQTCAPDGDVIFPVSTMDPQRAPRVFWRTWLSPQELKGKEITEGWNSEWVEYMIEHMVGHDTHTQDGEYAQGTQKVTTVPTDNDNEMCMVVYGYQRLIADDGSEGIYLTVFHPEVIDKTECPNYATHELMSGYEDYPLVVTRLTVDQKRLYEGRDFISNLRGPQSQVKVETDGRIDRAGMATLPPLMHPAGRPPSEWGPGRKVGYRRAGEIHFGPTPPNDTGGLQVAMELRQQADRAVGLDFENPMGRTKQEFYVTKFLEHVRDVLKMSWKLYQKMGDDDVFFQVTGSPDPQTISRGDPNEEYDIVVAFDLLMSDPESAEAKTKQMVGLMQYDRNGRIDMDKFLEFLANAIDPVLADAVLQPSEVSHQKMTKNVTDDLAKIHAGIEVPAQQQGAQIALQLIQAYAQQPDIGKKLQEDEMFAERISKYAEQYTFQLQQQENAEIGKIGTAPATVGPQETQSMPTG